MKYIIRFYGCPAGRLNTAMKEWVTKVVEAENEEAAALKAYDTHDHLIPSRTLVQPAVALSNFTEICMADSYHCLAHGDDGTNYAPQKWLEEYRVRVAKGDES